MAMKTDRPEDAGESKSSAAPSQPVYSFKSKDEYERWKSNQPEPGNGDVRYVNIGGAYYEQTYRKGFSEATSGWSGRVLQKSEWDGLTAQQPQQTAKMKQLNRTKEMGPAKAYPVDDIATKKAEIKQRIESQPITGNSFEMDREDYKDMARGAVNAVINAPTYVAQGIASGVGALVGAVVGGVKGAINGSGVVSGALSEAGTAVGAVSDAARTLRKSTNLEYKGARSVVGDLPAIGNVSLNQIEDAVLSGVGSLAGPGVISKPLAKVAQVAKPVAQVAKPVASFVPKANYGTTGLSGEAAFGTKQWTVIQDIARKRGLTLPKTFTPVKGKTMQEGVASVWADPSKFNTKNVSYLRRFGYTGNPRTQRVVADPGFYGFQGTGSLNQPGNFLTGYADHGVGVHMTPDEVIGRGRELLEKADQVGMFGKNGEFYPIWGHRIHSDTKGGCTVRAATKGGDGGEGPQEVATPVQESTSLANTGGPRIVINPSTFHNEKDAMCVAWNEALRIVMEETGFDPVSEPTDAQREFFADTAYADDELQLRRTILARICTFDTSVKDPTDEQIQEAIEFVSSVMEGGFPRNEWEQSCLKKILDILSSVPIAPNDGSPRTPVEPPQEADPGATASELGGQTQKEEERDLTAGGAILADPKYDAQGPAMGPQKDSEVPLDSEKQDNRNLTAGGAILADPKYDAQGPAVRKEDELQ